MYIFLYVCTVCVQYIPLSIFTISISSSPFPPFSLSPSFPLTSLPLSLSHSFPYQSLTLPFPVLPLSIYTSMPFPLSLFHIFLSPSIPPLHVVITSLYLSHSLSSRATCSNSSPSPWRTAPPSSLR